MKHLILAIIFLFTNIAHAERKVDAGFVEFKHQVAPGNPAAGYKRFYCKSDDECYFLNSAGTEQEVLSGLVDLASEISGVLGLANGGTNKNMTAVAGGLVYTDADSMEVSAAGTAGQLAQSGGTGSPTFWNPTQGSVFFAGASGVAAQDNSNLFFDDTNNRLAIGNASPNVGLDVNSDFALRDNDDATTGNIDALNTSAKGAIRLTAGSAVSLRGVANGFNGKVVIVSNATGNILTVVDQDTNPVAANRIITGTGDDLAIADGGAIIVKYDSTTQRWRVIGGSGGGSTGYTVEGLRGTPDAIVAGTGVTFAVGTKRLKKYIEGSGGAVDITANPQIQAGTIDGQEMLLCGRNNTNTVLFENGTGLAINGNAELAADDCLTLSWDTSVWVEISRNF